MALSNVSAAVTWYLNEDFESGQIPAGWTQEVLSSNVANWAIESTSSTAASVSGNTSGYYMGIVNQTDFDQFYVTRLITPPINFMASANLYQPQLVFRHAQPAYGNDFDTLKIYYRSNANASWALMKVYDSSSDVWSDDTLALLGINGARAYQLAFEYTDNMGRGVMLDDVRIRNTASCQPATDMMLSVPGAGSVVLTWTGDLSTDSFEVVVSKTAIVDWTNYTAVYHGYATDFSLNVTGLEPSNTYFAYVRAHCYDSEEDWTDWASTSFTTRAQVRDFPYYEVFSKDLPDGWSRGTNMSGVKPVFSTGASYSIDSTYALSFSGISAGKYAYAALPELNVASLQNVEVRFWGYAANNIHAPGKSTIAKLNIGVMSDPEDFNTFELVDSVKIDVAYKHQHFAVSFRNYSGSGKYIAFMASDPKYTSHFYIDRLEVLEPAVLTPADVQIANATPDGFDVKVNTHGAASWNLRVARSADYKHLGVLPTSFLYSRDGISGTSVHVSGNYGDSIVSVYVQAVNGSNVSEWTFPVTLRIPARATLPLHYAFEQQDDSIFIRTLDHEIRMANSTKAYAGLYFPLLDFSTFYPYITSKTTKPVYSNSSHLRLSGIDRWVTLPYIDSFAGMTLSFRLAAASAGQSRVAVGVMTDPYDLSTFTQLGVFDGGAAEYVKYEVDMDSYTGTGHYIAIRAIAPAGKLTSGGGSINHIDDLRVEPTSNCRLAVNPAVQLGESTAVITWDGRGMQQWQVVLSKGHADSVVNTISVNAASVTFSNLDSQTRYYYRINTLCGNDTVLAENVYSFFTPFTMPFLESFSTSKLPTGWDNSEGTTTSASYKWSSNTNGQSGRCLRFNSLNNALGNTNTLASPPVLLQRDAQLSFQWKNAAGGGAEVLISTDGGATRSVLLDSLSLMGITDWTEIAIDLRPYTGQCAIFYFDATSNKGTGDAYMYLDEVVIDDRPSCIIPSGLKVLQVGSGTADLAWTAGDNETQWQYVCIPQTDTLNWDNAPIVSAPQVSLRGLNGITTYDFYVRAYCGAEAQSEYLRTSFTTPCGTITAPYSENFNSITSGIPECWDNSLGTTTTEEYKWSSYASGQQGKCLRFNSYSNSRGKTNLLATPDIYIATGTKLTFSWKNPTGGAGEVLIAQAGDTTNMTSLLSTGLTDVSEWSTQEINLSSYIGQTVTIYFKATSNWGSGDAYLYLDNFALRVVDVNCLGITSLRAGATSATDASITWNASGNQEVDIVLSTSPQFSDSVVYTGVTANPFFLSDLTGNTTYYVRAKQSCDPEHITLETSFKTLCSSKSIDQLGVVDFNSSSDLDCWSLGVSLPGERATDAPAIYRSSSLGNFLFFRKNATESDTIGYGDGLYAIMPLLDIDSINHYEVVFRASKTSQDPSLVGRLAVGVITDPSDFSTFSSVQLLNLEYATDSTQMKNYTVSFHNYLGDYNDDFGKFIMFFAQGGDSAFAIALDHIEVRDVSSCPMITEGVITKITSTSAEYSWTATGAASYTVSVFTQPGDPDVMDPVFTQTVTTDNVLITDLNPVTYYYAYVRANCGDEVSNWSAHTRFHTDCGPVVLPYQSAFNYDAGEGLECWSIGNKQSSVAAYVPVINARNQLALNAYLNVGSSATYADSAYAILPQMDYGTEGLQNITLSFNAYAYTSPSMDDAYYKHILVGVVERGEDIRSFVPVEDIELGTSVSGSPYDVSFDSYNGSDGRIAFLVVVNPDVTAYGSQTSQYSSCYVQDIRVAHTPACPEVSWIETEVGRRRIDVQLHAKNGQHPQYYEFVWSPNQLTDLMLESAEKIVIDSTGTYAIKGLNRGTTYYLYARAYCNEEDGVSAWLSKAVRTNRLQGCDEKRMVGEGSENSQYLPTYSYYKNVVSEQIYTPAEIGGATTISSVAFYNTGSSKTRTVDLYVLHTRKASFTSNTDWVNVSPSDLVFSGEVEFAADEWTTLPFNEVFDYNGTDNLLLVMDDNTGSYSSGMSCLAFSGASDQAIYVYRDPSDINPYAMGSESGNRASVKNQLQLGVCYQDDPCPALEDITVELVGNGTEQAIVRWDNSGDDYMGSSDVILSTSPISSFTDVVPSFANAPADSILLSGLSPETTYYVYVRANCNADGANEGISDWAGTSFTTLATCPGVVDLSGELTDANALRVSWTTAYAEQALSFAYVYSTDQMDDTELSAAQKQYVNNATSFELSGLEYDRDYYIYVASVCDDETSAWSQIVVKTDATCAPVRNLTISRLQHNLVVLTWNKSLYGSESSWEAGILGEEENAVVVNSTDSLVSAMLIGLNPATTYTAYVRALCDGGQSSSNAIISFTTESVAEGCILIGNEETTSESYTLPFDNFYKNAWTQTIYKAEEIGGQGTILSVKYDCTSVPSDEFNQSVTIYLAHTSMTQATSTTAWVPQASLVQVYSNSNFVHPSVTGWVEIPLTTPFVYNGTDNLAVVISTRCADYSSELKYAYTTATDSASLYRNNDSDQSYASYPGSSTGTRSTVKPNVQFCFASGGCKAVTDLQVSDVTMTTANIAWEPMGSERQWEVFLSTEELKDLTTITPTTVNHYQQAVGDLSPDTDYWYYVRAACGGEWSVVHFITVSECPAPVELTIEAVTEQSAALSWTDFADAGKSYTVIYGEAETFDMANASTYQSTMVNVQQVSLSGLVPNTEYSVAVAANCDTKVSRFSEVLNFHTDCAAVTLFPWNENFDAYESGLFQASCWDNEHISGSGTSLFSINATSIGGNATHTLYLPDMASGTVTRLSLPYVDVPDTNYEFALDIYRNTSSYPLEGIRVFAAYDDGEQELAFIPRCYAVGNNVIPVESASGWYNYELPLPKSGKCRIILQGESRFGSATHMDNLVLRKTPTCARISDVTVSGIGDTYANVSWTQGGTETQWQYICVPSDAVVDWTNATVVNATTVNITGLQPSTLYNVYVRSYCGADEYGIELGASFATECGAITTLPWRENFNNLSNGEIPLCWDNTEGTSTAAYGWACYPGTSYGDYDGTGPDGTLCVSFDSYYNPNGNTNVLVTPPVLLSDPAKLKFDWKNPTGGDAQVLIAEVGDTARTVLITPAQLALKAEWTAMEADLSDYEGKTVKIYFHSTSNFGSSGAYHYLDNVEILVLDPNCGGVKNVSVSDISVSSATIHWAYVRGNSNAQVQVATDGSFVNILDSATLVNADSYALKGLQRASTYYVRVRQICDDDQFSDWTAVLSFSTPAYGLPYIPVFSATKPDDWKFSNTAAASVFGGAAMDTVAMGTGSSTTSWNRVAPDSLINSYHFKGNIYGSSWHYWAVSPSIDMSDAVGEGILLSVDAGMIPYSSSSTATYTGTDDRFLVAVSTDGGASWEAADVVAEWNNSGTGDYVYNEVPTTAQTYRINMSDYAGQSVCLGFYGESTVSNADNWFHFGNIRLETVETIHYVDTICYGYSFNKNGFRFDYDELEIGLNTFSRYEQNATGEMQITIQQILVNAAADNDIYVDLCQDEHYNGYGFDFTADQSRTYRHRVRSGSVFGCDSTVYLHVNVQPVLRGEEHVGTNDDSYTWNGRTFYQSTVAFDTTSSVITGCDSITTLYLTFCGQGEYNYHAAFCAGSSYTDEFFQNLTAPGEYDNTITDEIGCVTSAHVILHQIAPGAEFVDTVLVKDLPYVLNNDTLCPVTDKAGFVYHGIKNFGCGMVNVTIVVSDGSALSNIKGGSLAVAPNPVSVGEEVQILTALDFGNDYECRVYDAVGKLVYQSKARTNTLPGMPSAGAYTIRITSGNAIYQAKLIVK